MRKKCSMLICIVLSLFFCMASVSAEIKTIEADGYYIVGDGPDEKQYIAKERAKNQALIRASEKAGVLVEGISETRNHMLTRDDVKMITASVMRIQSEDYSMAIIENNAIQYTCHIVAKVDTGKVDGYFAGKAKENDELLQKKVELEEKNAKLTKDNIQLKDLYSKARTEADKAKIALLVYKNESQFEALYLTEKALNCRNMGDWSAAEDLYKQAISKDKRCYQAYVGLGQVYEYQGYTASNNGQSGTSKYKAAFKNYENGFTLAPERNPYIYYGVNGMARVSRWLGDNETAKIYYEVIYNLPDYHGYRALASWSLAVIYYNEGDYGKAKEWCNNTLRIPDDGSEQDKHSKDEVRKLLQKI